MTQSNFGFDPIHKKTRKEIFLDEMNRVVPWDALVALIQPHARGAHQALGGRPPFAVETMLRIQCRQLWWNDGLPSSRGPTTMHLPAIDESSFEQGSRRPI